MLVLSCILLLLHFQNGLCQMTKKENILLSRKKRYLFFPKGANFVYQIVDVKALMKTVPKGVQWLNEFDIPFPLPSDPGVFRKYRKEHRQRREILTDYSVALDRVPKYVIWFNEWLAPFALPSDPSQLRDLRRKHRIHRRHILENVDTTLVRLCLTKEMAFKTMKNCSNEGDFRQGQ